MTTQKDSKINSFTHFLKLLIADFLAIWFLGMIGYLAAWMMLGEGTNSNLYTSTTLIIMGLIIGIISTAPFILKYQVKKKSNFELSDTIKAKNYKLIIIINVTIYLLVVLTSALV